MPEPSTGILGRISGKLLSSNLERDGIDLTFRNNPLDPDLLYLDVNNLRVGINQTPNFDLHISNGISTNSIVDNQITIANNDLIFNTSQISSLTNSITILPDQSENPIVIMEKNHTSQLEINDNYILNYTPNGSIALTASGAGVIRFESNTLLNGDLYVSGNINLSGNLSKQGNLILGDDIIDMEGNLPENDTVDFNVPFAQHLLPGLDNSYDLGGSRGDSSAGRWSELYVTDNLVNTNEIITLGVTVSNQLFIDGVNGQISSIQSNDDVKILPDTGITYIEQIKIGGIPSLAHTTLTLDNPNLFGTANLDNFGTSVDISGSYIIIGAPSEDDAGGTNSGKAYIFNITSGMLLYTLDNPNAFSTSGGDTFGISVSISDLYAVVGAPSEDDAGGTNSGKVYVYSTSSGSLLYTLDNPNAYNTSASDRFGSSIAVSNSHIIIGASLEDDAGGASSGKAYIYSALTGTLLYTLDNPNAYSTTAGDNFGFSVDICQSYAIVGAYLESDIGGSASGKAYIYSVTNGALLYTLDNPNDFGTSADDRFGQSVAISESYAIVGAPREDDAITSSSGKAYIFSTSTGALIHTLDSAITAPSVGNTPDFGYSVAISDFYAVVSAPGADDISDTDSGRVFVFDVQTAALVSTINNPNAYSTGTSDEFGTSLAINEANIIVGVPNEDDAGGTESGKSYVFLSTYTDANHLTNLNITTPLQVANTGTGYTRFAGSNGLVIPSGNTSQQSAYEIGATRWNTELSQIECFDGTIWIVATGPGSVDADQMSELGVLYTLILG